MKGNPMHFERRWYFSILITKLTQLERLTYFLWVWVMKIVKILITKLRFKYRIIFTDISMPIINKIKATKNIFSKEFDFMIYNEILSANYSSRHSILSFNRKKLSLIKK